MTVFTLDDLRRIMREAAGEGDAVDLDGDILDTPFGDLDYDSLAVLEMTVRVEREFGVKLGDDEVGGVKLPSEFIDLVNSRLQPGE
ncbi:acyl carrier protein [Nonomuraea endophytica]|uniref:Act minimal PKS acyl carrier protein n=1 Tax=Nonomuraea endophytica TaxID=714136 RepID=A0A7W8A8Y3_9ACTN|nr:acyl carrier protein [Nonomuraea endophytica]MBB5080433.1 act minimal PKS acyl carrier protein [Nonomuraea endophytica]